MPPAPLPSWNPPRLVLAGANSGAGKTTLSIGLMAAWTREGRTVQPFKVGPDFIDPAFHTAVTGRPSRNLDAWLMPGPELAALFARHAPRPGLSLVEGVMGLYDGLGNGPFAGTAHVAALLEAPVALVINAEGMSLSAAALVSGYANFRPLDPQAGLSGLRIGGVILNHVSDDRQYALLREVIERHTGIPCFGYLPRKLPSLPHRHLGLVPAGEQRDLLRHIDALANAVTDHVDLPGLRRLAESAPALRIAGHGAAPTHAANDRPTGRVRIGVAKDAAFSFYYPDNLECLEELGAELVPFSPLADTALPDGLDGLYLGGGFPEVFAEQLEANAGFRTGLRRALEAGMPAYAECGGMLYLCAALVPEAPLPEDTIPEKSLSKEKPGDGPARAMTGFFPARAAMTKKLQPFGYVTITLERDCLLGPAGAAFRAHEFHYSRLLNDRDGGSPDARANHPGPPLIRSEKPDGRAWTGGMARNNVVAWYPHLHFRGCPHAAQSFVSACRAFRAQGLATP